MINLKHLEAFYAIMHTGSITVAGLPALKLLSKKVPKE
jgi:hypothetical protein